MGNNFKGLTNEQVKESRKLHGDNHLVIKNTETFLEKFIGNFKDPIIIILMVALGIYTVLAFVGYTQWYEAVGIAIAVLIATMVATLSEHKNESSFQKLQEEASMITNKVFRDGNLLEIPVGEIVVGDYVLLQPGDKIPADGHLLKGDLKVNQASLTGEPDNVVKLARKDGKDSAEKDLFNKYRVFRGSVVADGEAVLVVETVGINTVYGGLVDQLGDNERDSPLKVKLSALADGISKFGYIGSVFIAVSFMFNKIVLENSWNTALMVDYLSNYPLLVKDLITAIILGVIIIVVAVPEGLPMMIAFVLSANMRKLLNSKVLVRKLIGIETSGSMNILFTDKTGTLTRGKLEAVLTLNGRGNTYQNKEDIPQEMREQLAEAVFRNTASVISFDEDGNEVVVGGNPTDRALVEYLKKFSVKNSLEEVIRTISFNSDRKFSATQVGGNVNKTFVKGAPEVVLDNCKYYMDENNERKEFGEEELKNLRSEMNGLAERSIRLIALAYNEEDIEGDVLPEELTLIGIVGIRDELRDDSREAVIEAKSAGIHVVMVTGDRKETAEAIAKEVGLIDSDSDVILTSAELRKMSDDEIKEILPRLAVVARALPTDKSRLVYIAQSMDLVVGMTGDGVNDSSALSISDVGFAMGSGTEVAKESSDVILLDDNFSSINKAVLYGRTIYNTIRKFIVFQLTVNVAALTIAFVGPFFGIELPLTMIQMLWVNLVMDTLAVLAFGGEAALNRYMKEKPKKRDENIISKDMWASILTNGFSIAILGMIFLNSETVAGMFSSEAAFLTGFFAFFIFLNNFNKFNARTEKLNLFEHISENKGFLRVVGLIFVVQIIFTYIGGDVLRTVGLTLNEWIIVTVMSVIIIPIDLCRKLIRDSLSKSDS